MTGKTSSHSALVGREREIRLAKQALQGGRNLLIEGPVGVGKTFLVLEILTQLKKKSFRVDGDTRYTEQKLTGWFDPPIVLKKGYTKDAFVEGPLVQAMKEGAALFVNELNRMPEAVQNILLPAMDERRLVIPKLGEIQAKPGFVVIATQNPREFTATHALSEALMDRFEMIELPYQSRAEELEILQNQLTKKSVAGELETIVDLIRRTREHPSVRRGASIRAGLSIAELLQLDLDLESACLMALPPRIEMISSDESPREFILQLLRSPGSIDTEKKKSL